MSATPPVPLTARFARIIGGLCRAVQAWAGPPPLTAPLALLILHRLARLNRRFARLVAHWEAGTLKPPRRREARPARPRPERPAAAPRLPRRFGWLLPLAPSHPHLVGHAASYRSHLLLLLEDPALPALLEAAPQAGRLLRPLCHMLLIAPPPCLRLPKRPRSRKVVRKAARKAGPDAPAAAAPEAEAPPRPAPAARPAPRPAPAAPRPRRQRPTPAPVPRACGPPPAPA